MGSEENWDEGRNKGEVLERTAISFFLKREEQGRNRRQGSVLSAFSFVHLGGGFDFFVHFLGVVLEALLHFVRLLRLTQLAERLSLDVFVPWRTSVGTRGKGIEREDRKGEVGLAVTSR